MGAKPGDIWRVNETSYLAYRFGIIDVYYNIHKQTGFKIKDIVVWNKGSAVPSKEKDVLLRTGEFIGVYSNAKVNEIGYLAIYKNIEVPYFKVTSKQLGNVWNISKPAKQNPVVPASFPPEVPGTAIVMSTRKGDIVADPFMGGGTTAVVALRLNRRVVGVEIDPVTVDFSITWLRQRGYKVELIRNGKIIKIDKEISVFDPKLVKIVKDYDKYIQSRLATIIN